MVIENSIIHGTLSFFCLADGPTLPAKNYTLSYCNWIVLFLPARCTYSVRFEFLLVIFVYVLNSNRTVSKIVRSSIGPFQVTPRSS